MAKYSDYAVRISQSTPNELNIITFELCINHINDALSFINTNDDEFSENLNYALSFLKEIMVSLDLKYPISAELLELYLYVNKLIIIGNINKDDKSLNDAIYILNGIKEGFESIDDISDVKVMQNTQKVFAGLTYGKDGSLSEYIDSSDSKGFKA